VDLSFHDKHCQPRGKLFAAGGVRIIQREEAGRDTKFVQRRYFNHAFALRVAGGGHIPLWPTTAMQIV
jgi:hypothetical protein